MDELLSDKVAVVTGGSSGIGRTIAKTFAEEGADIVVADVREDAREGGTPTHELISEETDSEAMYVDCDVSKPDDLEASVEAAERYGGVDIMVNNAGIFRGEDFLDVSEQEYDQLMDINVKGVFFGAQAAAKRMIANSGGSIINLSSVAGLEGTGEYVTYCTSKGAVRLMTYALADKLGPEGVRVNAIHPGVIETTMTTDDVAIVGTEEGEMYEHMIPSRRFGTPTDVANGALYLASDLADYVNGESLVLDGGLTNTG
ncbi:3-ketoacyl-ACP reductase [Haladaptatus sp. W1]|uniref:SDR family oxidoreductase n=1 Tax=Haladaptatus sp. W1 TaxID=1897478 RepID=UPI00084992A3|nr:SDR family oxidoreductase [Haladaptatus sp. W1]ODR79356.1 3-ketoacyl-ACP reductase [Haladaptatus sp. W1]